MHTDSWGLAYQMSRRAVEVNPINVAAYHNVAKCYHERQKDDLADEWFRRAVKLKPNYSNALEGLSMSSLNRGDFQQCIHYSNLALAENPETMDARVNRGMAYLALKRWGEGWRDYNCNLGKEKNRKEMKYGDEPRWDGSKGKNIVVYGEQGIGDEISFASMLPDLIRDCKSVTLETDKRTAPLFRRSFGIETYGTRYKPEEARAWTKNKTFDARVALGELGAYYRQKDSDFTGKPYLIPNEDMALQWRAILKRYDRPKIGITWTGGVPKTGQHRRSVTLDTYGPLFKSFDAEWISLQYKDYEGIPAAEQKYGVKIHDWEWGSRYWDFDQTVALISELDLVISVCTTVVHAAGAIGKETLCLVPKAPLWRYLKEGEHYPWAGSVSLYRQSPKGEWPIHLILGKLKDRFGNRPRHGHPEGTSAVKEAA